MRLLSSRRLAISLWVLTLLAISIVITLKPGKLYRTFAAAGDHFRNGEQLYPRTLEDTLEMEKKGLELFRYTPLVAASFVPWSFLPESVGGILWRVLQAVILLLALRAWAKVAVPQVPWPALAILALPLCAGNFH